jgi:predicted transcriptional regulator
MKKLVTFRFDADVLAKARQLAQRDNRTLTNFIETILKQALDSREWDDDPIEVRGDRV